VYRWRTKQMVRQQYLALAHHLFGAPVIHGYRRRIFIFVRLW
jgi:hypothetical protein